MTEPCLSNCPTHTWTLIVSSLLRWLWRDPMMDGHIQPSRPPEVWSDPHAVAAISNMQYRHLIPAVNTWAFWTDRTPWKQFHLSWVWKRPQLSDLTTDCHAFSWAWMHEFLTMERSIDSLTTWVIHVVGLCSACYPWCLYTHALADVQSTGAGIKCLYCGLISVRS